jgi:nitronate monooxygenase
MNAWPDPRLLDLLRLEIPIIQAPMAGSDSVALARSVSSTGALGSLACALLSPHEVGEAVCALSQGMTRPFNLNFFCHTMERPHPDAMQKWKNVLRPHYERLGLDIESVAETRLRRPFNDEMCAIVEEARPEVVSFHFGLPEPALVERLKRQRIKILSSATSVREAKWLESNDAMPLSRRGLRRAVTEACSLKRISRLNLDSSRWCLKSGMQFLFLS